MFRKIILNSLYYSGAQAALAPLMRGMGSIFMLHHVRNLEAAPFSPNKHLSTSPEFLDHMILKLKEKGYDFISMDEVEKRLSDPKAHQDRNPFISMTLDDGYRDNLLNAVPVFRRHEIPYLIYVAPGLTDATTPLWWEDLEHVIAKQKSILFDLGDGKEEFDLSTPQKKQVTFQRLIDHLMLNVDEDEQRSMVANLANVYRIDSLEHVRKQVMGWRDLAELMKDPFCTIGAHTIGHYALAKLDEKRARFEMLQSREIIRKELGESPKHFAYPYGFPEVVGSREFEIARECGFATATTTRHGVIYPEHNEHMTALPRVSINGNHQSMHYVETLLSGIPTRFNNKGQKLDVA